MASLAPALTKYVIFTSAPSQIRPNHAGLTLRARCASRDVSLRFLGTYVGGYGIWLLYGLSIQSAPIVVVHAIGLATGTVTLIVALRLRGPLLRPGRTAACC